MIKASRSGLGLILSAWAFLNVTSTATAQLAPPPTSTGVTPPSAAMMMNPFYNPYMNPLLNPSAPQQKLSMGSSLLYMYSANSARGGIGSGRLSTGAVAGAGKKKPANMPNTAARPGGGAARFFNPGPVNASGAGRYYNQRGRSFMNNGN